MRTAVLSGKGGTGKTFVAVNLAYVIGNSVYCDCDVEEPDGALFFRPRGVISEDVYVKVPVFDLSKCTGCKACTEFCRFNALAFVKGKPMLFEEICHFCGGCEKVCRFNAIFEREKKVGVVASGKSGDVTVISGILNIGEPSAVPVIKEELKLAEKSPDGNGRDIITDCPPGSACSVMESVASADYCVLVTEPGPFAFSNFRMVHELAFLLKKPCGAIINKYTEEYPPLTKYCLENNIPILARIPFKKETAALLSEGTVLSEKDSEYYGLFSSVYDKIKEDYNRHIIKNRRNGEERP